MFHGYQKKQWQIMMWCGLLMMAFALRPVGAQAATILAAFNFGGEPLRCESPFTSIGGEDVAGQALVLSLDFQIEVPIEVDGGVGGAGRPRVEPIGIRKNLDGCTPLLLQALVRSQVGQVILTIFDNDPAGRELARTRITLDTARIGAVQAEGTQVEAGSSMTATQEFVLVVPGQVMVEDLVASTEFRFDFVRAE